VYTRGFHREVSEGDHQVKFFFGKKALLPAAAILIAMVVPPHASSTNAKMSDSTPEHVQLRILETTDLHDQIVNYDYYKNVSTNEFGFAKTATLIKKARREVNNSMLFDNGDLIQGNPLADYMAKVKGLWGGYTHPVFRAMNEMHYDAATVGNHEFNYGLKYLKKALDTANFPYVNANIYLDDHDNDPHNDVHLFRPYMIIPKKVKTEDGKTVTIQVGVIGFTTPIIMQWDKKMLTGTIKAKGIAETAKEIVPEMKKAGADVIIALAHTGLDTPQREKNNPEYSVFQLSKVRGINAILFGHIHRFFPGSSGFDGIKGIDNKYGKINSVVAVEAGYWGNGLGVIDMNLARVNGKWNVVSSRSSVRKIYDYQKRESLAKPDRSVLKAAGKDHKKAIRYSRNKIGHTRVPLNSFFSRMEDTASLELVSDAQTWYVKNFIQTFQPVYENFPLLSAVAPIKSGVHGPNDFTYIPKGEMTLNSASDLYPFNNTIKVVEMNGAQIKEWLEMSASEFNQMDLKSKEAQELINQQFQPYNFDVIEGLKYEIDILEPPKYKWDGTLINKQANRIKHLRRVDGRPIDLNQRFLVITNSYRTNGGGNFPGFKQSKPSIMINTGMELRKAIIAYVKEEGRVEPKADGNWRIQPLNGETQVTFKSALKGKKMLKKKSRITFLKKESDDTGRWGIYSLKPNTPKEKPSAKEKDK
jgi:2',3'-cyclic-nucleotide 2'-phosphodiesterase